MELRLPCKAASLTWSRRAITPRTKIIMLNTPHNPIGKAFTREEYSKIAQLVEEFNLLVISDEVVSIHSAPVFPTLYSDPRAV